MKTNVSQRKIEILQSENTKLPKLARSKTEIASEKEKVYLEEEPHVNESTAEKGVMYPPLEVKLNHKKQIINKPREDYLKEKIKMDYNSDIFSNIQKGLGSQVENIKTQIKDKNLVLTEVPKDLNKYIVRSSSTENNIIKYSNEDYENKKKYKIIKDLKEEQFSLKNKLKQIEENEALLNDEGFMNLNNSNQSTTKYDKSIREQQMKDIKNKKNEINERLIEIESRINIILDEERSKVKKKMNSQIIKENFERDREIMEAKAKKFLKEINERNKHLIDMAEKRKKDFEDKERKYKEKEDKKLKDFIKNLKEKEQERANKNKEIMLKYKPYINEKYEKTDYLYILKEEKDKEDKENKEKLIVESTRKKRMENKTVTNEELQEFWNKIDKKKEGIKENKLKKEKEEMEKFEFAKNYKPSYTSHFNEIIEEEYIKLKEKEKLRKEEIVGLNELKRSYGENIRNTKRPVIDEDKQKEIKDRIVAIENPKLIQIKETLEKRKEKRKKRVLLKKRDPNKPSKYKYELKLDEGIENLNNSAIIQSHLIKRPKPIKFAYDYSKEKDKKNDDKNKDNKDNKDDKENKENKENKDIKKKKEKNEIIVKDYLREIAKKRKLTEEKKNKEKIDDNVEERQKEREKKWKKELSKKNGNITVNIYNVKQQAENLEEKAKREQQLLKLNGGIENNPELGKQVTGHIIDSIEAKLSILNQMYQK